MDTIYKAILDRLTAEVPEYNWIDWDIGQLDAFKENYPVQFPCCLIDFPSIQWTDQGDEIEMGDTMVQLRIAWNMFDDWNKHTPEAVKVEAQAKFDIIKDTYKALKGFDADNFSPLTRMQQTTERRVDGLKVITIQFTCELYDESAIPERTTQARPDLDMDISYQ